MACAIIMAFYSLLRKSTISHSGANWQVPVYEYITGEPIQHPVVLPMRNGNTGILCTVQSLFWIEAVTLRRMVRVAVTMV